MMRCSCQGLHGCVPVAPSATPRVAGEREQPAPALVLALERVGEVLALAGADLDLRGDQLAGDRVGQHVVARGRRLAEPLERVGRATSVSRIEQRELLLEPDREVGRGLEDLPRRQSSV